MVWFQANLDQYRKGVWSSAQSLRKMRVGCNQGSFTVKYDIFASYTLSIMLTNIFIRADVLAFLTQLDRLGYQKS